MNKFNSISSIMQQRNVALQNFSTRSLQIITKAYCIMSAKHQPSGHGTFFLLVIILMIILFIRSPPFRLSFTFCLSGLKILEFHHLFIFFCQLSVYRKVKKIYKIANFVEINLKLHHSKNFRASRFRENVSIKL